MVLFFSGQNNFIPWEHTWSASFNLCETCVFHFHMTSPVLVINHLCSLQRKYWIDRFQSVWLMYYFPQLLLCNLSDSDEIYCSLITHFKNVHAIKNIQFYKFFFHSISFLFFLFFIYCIILVSVDINLDGWWSMNFCFVFFRSFDTLLVHGPCSQFLGP